MSGIGVGEWRNRQGEDDSEEEEERGAGDERNEEGGEAVAEGENEQLIAEMQSLLLHRLLMGSRDFERHWANRIVDALAESERSEDAPTSSHKCEPAPDSLEVAVRDVADTVEQLTETFLNSADLALCHCDAATVNHDSVELFDCRRVVMRLEGAAPQRVGAAARKVSRLTRTLAARLSTPFHVANCAQLAIGLCDLLYTLEHQLDLFRHPAATSLAAATARMNTVVVGGLQELLRCFSASFRTPPSRRPSSSPSSTSLAARSAPTRRRSASSRVTSSTSAGNLLLHLRLTPKKPPPGRSPGFILSYQLREAREKLPPRRPAGRRSGSKETSDLPCERVKAIEEKWARVLQAEPLFVRSLRTDREGSIAARLARVLTSEVLEELDKRTNEEVELRNSDRRTKIVSTL